MADDLLWAYGVVAAGATLPGDIVGVAGGAIAPVAAGGLAALTSRVPRADFAAQPLREHLNDLPWLERVAREHEAVLDQVLATATVVPLRLCTIYEDGAGVERMLEREREALAEALARLEGRQEWGVKLLVERATGQSGQPADSGAAYLARRRQEQAEREQARALTAQLVDDVDATLRALAADAVRLPGQNRELSGHRGDMVLNAAYLVDDPQALRACVAELQERYAAHGAQLELTGPWPPYNFVASPAAAQPA
jgi:Gas vesicle synthesis protein GvpL/GvpF